MCYEPYILDNQLLSYTLTMSFIGYKERVEAGDTVLIFLGFENMVTFQIQKNKTHQIRYGALPPQ